MSDKGFECALRLNLPDARCVSQTLGISDWKLAKVTVLNCGFESIGSFKHVHPGHERLALQVRQSCRSWLSQQTVFDFTVDKFQELGVLNTIGDLTHFGQLGSVKDGQGR